MNKRVKLVAAVLFCAVFMNGVPAFADDGVDGSIIEKALLEGVYDCFDTKGAVKSNLGKASDLKNITPAPGSSDGQLIKAINIIGTDVGHNDVGNAVPLPNGYTKIEDNNVSCKELLYGYRSGSSAKAQRLESVFTYFGKDTAETQDTQEKIDEFLGNIGYDTNAEAKGECVRMHYDVKYDYHPKDNHETYSQWLCISDTNATPSQDNLSLRDSSTYIYMKIAKDKLRVRRFDQITWYGADKWTDFKYSNYSSWGDLKDGIESNFSGEHKYGSSGTTYYAYVPLFDSEPYGEKEYKFFSASGRGSSGRLTGAQKAGRAAIRYLTGKSSLTHEDLRFTPEQNYDLYMAYLKDFYGLSLHCSDDGLTAEYPLNVNIIDTKEGTAQECHAKVTKHNDGNKDKNKVYGMDRYGLRHFSNELYYYDELITEINKLIEENLNQ